MRHFKSDRPIDRTARRNRGALLLCLASLLVAARQASAAGDPPRPIPQRESPDQAPSAPIDPGPIPGFNPRGPFNPGVQVNINAAGQNIINDAANEPSLCIDPTRRNRIAIGWRQFDTIGSNFRQAGRAFSRDSGRTWKFTGPLTPGVFRSDPVLRSNAAGRFYYYSLSSLTTCEMFVSDNGGRTWGAPIAAFGGDKAWFAVDTTGGIGDGNIYVGWSEFAGCCDADVFTRSIDDSATYSSPIGYPNGGVFGTLDVAPDGKVYSIGTLADTFGSSNFVMNRSTNARNPANPTVTFDISTIINMGGGMGFGSPSVNPGGLLGQAQVVVDHSGGSRNGWVYGLCSVTIDPNTPGADPMDVHLVRSTNEGQTWSAPIKIGDDPAGVAAWQWFGTIGIAPNGRLDVVWNDTRVDPVNPNVPTQSALFYSFSADGGVTWSAVQQLGPAWNHLVGFPQQNKIGDYYDIVSDNVGASLAYAATYNGEQDVWFLRIGDYDCNGNDIGDLTDIQNATSQDINHNGDPDECECLGNTNSDETVDLSDLSTLLSAFGSCTGGGSFNPAADFDSDGCITLTDLSVLLARFGSICP